MINTFGSRITMMFGVTGYPIYIGGLWYFDVYGKLWFLSSQEHTSESQLAVSGVLLICQPTLTLHPPCTNIPRFRKQRLRRRVPKRNLARHPMVLQRIRRNNRRARRPRHQSLHNIRRRPPLCLHHLHHSAMLLRRIRGVHAAP